MQLLPTIELIGFLDWVDLNRTELLPGNQTIEEFFLNSKNNEYAHKIASRYLSENPPPKYPDTNVGKYEKWLDVVLKSVKIDCIKKFRHKGYDKFRCESNDEIYYEIVRDTINELHLKYLDEMVMLHNSITLTPTADKIIEDINATLSFGFGNMIEDYLANLDGTSANAVKGFLRFFIRETQINMKNDNIPLSVIGKYIQKYVDDCFFNRRLSEAKRIELKNILIRAFGEDDHVCSNYFVRLTSINSYADRYWERRVRYKCVFLAEDTEFYRLVENNWRFLNNYSGDYLDIFYNPDELLMKGYQLAEKLDIRGSVDQYPSIFLWHTSLLEGKAIPVGGLQLDELLSIIKIIIEDIARKSSFDDVVQNALKNIEKIKQIAVGSEVLQEKFLNNLYRSCLQLQSNKVIFGKAQENQRNTQIRDLLSNLLSSPIEINSKQFQFFIQDQTLQGLSSKGKTFGEIDLLVTLNRYPYAIIEALNIQSDQDGKHWNRSTLDEHISRIGKYDQNGLKRNFVMIYSNSDNFEKFYESLLHSLLTSTKHYKINDCRIDEIRDISDVFLNSTANTRVICSRYFVNGIERTLFFFVVKF